MAYTRSWDETVPAGTSAASSIDTLIQNVKTDLRERLVTAFGLAAGTTDFDDDPFVIKSMTLTSGLTVSGGTTAVQALTATTGVFSSTVSGITTLAGTGAVSGFTTGTFSGTFYIGDTTNADVTLGLTINQGAADDQILALKSSDVAHGITTVTETDTYGSFSKLIGVNGGLIIAGYSEATAGLFFGGYCTTEDTVKSGSASSAIVIRGATKSGTNVTTMGANTNILTVQSFTATKFILDADGDSHQDVGTAWTNFDEHDDIALLNKLSAHVTRHDDPLRDSFRGWLEESREPLERIELVTFNEDGHHFVNMSRLQMLTIGAIRQLAARITMIEERGLLSA